MALLTGRDHAAYWTEATVSGKTVYRVRVGSFATREAAKELAEGLASEFELDYWIAPEAPATRATAEATPAPAETAAATPRPSPKASAVGRATPISTPEPGSGSLLKAAMRAHGGETGGFAVVDRAASIRLSYRLKSLDAKTGAPVFTRHVYRRKGKDRLRLEITPIGDASTAARDAHGRPIEAPPSATVYSPQGAWVSTGGERAMLPMPAARARIEALGPSGVLRLPLAFPARGAAAVGITRTVAAGTRTLNGQPAVRLDASPPPRPYKEASLYLDPGSERLIAARFLTDAGELLLTFDDYRTIAPGLIVPFERVVYRDGTVVSSVEIDELSLDVEIEDSLFAR